MTGRDSVLERLAPGDSIFTPDVVLSPDGPKKGWSVAVAVGAFVAAGSTANVLHARPDLPEVVLPGMALIPGFVDSHQHLTQVFAKALIAAQPAQIWRRMWLPLYAAMSPEDAYAAAKWTCVEALRGGFTTIITAGERDPSKVAPIEQAIADVGIRCGMAHDFSDLTSYSTPGAGSTSNSDSGHCIRTATNYLATTASNPRMIRLVACASPQSASTELIAALAKLAAETSTVFQIHANEHTPEVEWSLESYGLRPIELLHKIRALGPQTLLAHATLVTPREIGIIEETGAAVSYNPVASSWKGNAVAPALEFAIRGIRFGLGTDATRSDGFRLMDAAETAQRLTSGIRVDDWESGRGALWVDAATQGGAGAAGLGGLTGAIREGLRADFLLLDTTAPELLPSWDFAWELVRYYDRTHLKAVFVDGEPVMIDGRPTGWDLDRFIREFEPVARRIITESSMKLIGMDPRQRR